MFLMSMSKKPVFFNVQLQVDTIKKFQNRSQRREAKAQNKPQVLDTGNFSDNNID